MSNERNYLREILIDARTDQTPNVRTVERAIAEREESFQENERLREALHTIYLLGHPDAREQSELLKGDSTEGAVLQRVIEYAGKILETA